MMFVPARFIVVDDKVEHVRAITAAFQQLGSPCMGIKYDSTEGILDAASFRGVRCLFLDLHLLGGEAGSDDKRNFALIAQILEDNISETGGPFILVVWSAYAEISDKLREYLEDSLDKEKVYARPLAVLSLPKDKFIDPKDESVRDPSTLKEAVIALLHENPQISAMLDWEADVIRSTGETLSSLLGLIKAEDQTSAKYGQALDLVLSRLAVEAVGKSHVEANRRSAIVGALAPLLTDRMLNQPSSQESTTIWARAITRHADNRIEHAGPIEAAKINSMMHIAKRETEPVASSDWGAVVKWPHAWTDEGVRAIFGLSIKDITCTEFKLRSAAIELVRPVLLRVGAACDYAQNSRGPISYLFGLEVPQNAPRLLDDQNKLVKMTDAIWRSPVLAVSGVGEPVRIYVHSRLATSVPSDATKAWEAYYRLREQLLMQLVNFATTYVARPGIVQLSAE